MLPGRQENQGTRNKSQGQVLEGTGGAGILDSRGAFHLQRGQAFASAAGGGGDRGVLVQRLGSRLDTECRLDI